jgi:CubicO group peptidase (beta-lactamase class C family)
MYLQNFLGDVLLVYQFITAVNAFNAVPILGPAYPAPKDFTSDESLINQAWKNFTNILGDKSSNTSDPSKLYNYTFSVGMFSLYDDGAAKLQYHHAGPDLVNSAAGVNKIDGDSIYRVGSVSKLFTAYMALLKFGSAYWDVPLITVFPQLSNFTDSLPDTILGKTNWTTITIGALAGQVADFARDPPPISTDALVLLAALGVTDPTPFGLPVLNYSDPAVLSSCAFKSLKDCDDDSFLLSLALHAPVFDSWTAPVYSNTNFALLGMAISKLVGRSLFDIFHDDLFVPLGMDSSRYNPPPADDTTYISRGVIPGGNASISFLGDGARYGASGGIFSTINDLAKFGVNILNSTLLEPAETRQWMKPVTHTHSFDYSVGRPWEIVRIYHPLTERVIDIYTKTGDVTHSSALFMILPDYAMGFSIATANSDGSQVAVKYDIADILQSSVLPALEDAAAAEAKATFAGTYKSNELNSSITLSVDMSVAGGLIVDSWISNSTDMFAMFQKLEELPYRPNRSIFPAQHIKTNAKHATTIQMRSTDGGVTKPDAGVFGRFERQGYNWVTMDSLQYGNVALDQFIFTTDDCGKPISLLPAATRLTLTKI